jgi:chromate transporter
VTVAGGNASPNPPHLAAIAGRFLRVGALAWGGPVAQIGVLHRELVEQERWVDEPRFRRALAVYQLLPGPEATEMCIWFGTVARGRLGGLLAGLGFVLPGLVLMLLASWLLLGRAELPLALRAAFVGMQCVVVALVLRASLRLGRSVLVADRALWPVLLGAGVLGWCDAPFWLALVGGGLFAALHHHRNLRNLLGATVLTAGIAWALQRGPAVDALVAAPAALGPDAAALAATGLRAGLLTFGGAYTAIPFLESDATGATGWMTLQTFQDGLAVGGMIPSPLIVVGAWVGFAGGGLPGALLVAATIFLPAFLMPLLLHDQLEAIAAAPRLHRLLEGVTAAVAGLIGVVAVQWALQLDAPWRWALAIAAWWLLASCRHRLAVLPIMAGAAAFGVLLR